MESTAHELVKVIEDDGGLIRLQHLLVVKRGDSERVVKHWRQDWQYEADSIYAFQGDRTWKSEPIPEDERAGTWPQTVYQVDDSPRYSSWGQWRHMEDHSFWESQPTWRPLPRRERKVRDDYDVLVGRNRHSITKDGWVHQQDNYKLAIDEGSNEVRAWERGFNTYKRIDDFDFSPAREYWESTAPFWKAVRAWWDDRIAQGKETRLAAEHNGASMVDTMFAHANDYADGEFEKPLAQAVASDIEPYLITHDPFAVSKAAAEDSNK